MSVFLRLTLFLVGATSLGLLLLLSLASSNSPSIDINYTWLLNANILLSMLMIILTGLLVRRAWLRYKKGAFGSKLIIRLAFTFAIIAFIIALLSSIIHRIAIYTFYVFASRL